MSNIKQEDKKPPQVTFEGTTPDPTSESKEATAHVESASQIVDERCRPEQARTMAHEEVAGSDLSARLSIEHEEAKPDLCSDQQPSVTSELPSAVFRGVTLLRSPTSPSYYPSSPPGSPWNGPNSPAYSPNSPNLSQTSPPYSPSSPPYHAPGSPSLPSPPQYGGGGYSPSSQPTARGSPTPDS
ncbi:unnamed protein product [Clonostachys rosea f. rosea IK726]|uniref:Uncharacterized protein n=1 Tax=Clonostachys rosea f. rosea IK726 TaxID=1349383 RepID=A0ACA9TWZ5_BIOOC|nr:unnamed protein product [Clonostachys rosea f. rosea IK726]